MTNDCAVVMDYISKMAFQV